MWSYSVLLGLALVHQATEATLPAAPAPQAAAEEAAAEASGHLRPPVLLSQVDPEFGEAARKKRLSGDVRLRVVVDDTGRAARITVLHGLGSGLDEAAVAAVKQYRWKPAMRDGQRGAMEIPLDVNFQIF